jgi:outer membrane cobalamin receptor
MSSVRHVQRVAALVLALLVGGYSNPASGQAPEVEPKKEAPAAEAEVAPKPAAAEEITVTATRFERLIDLTPQSVTVLDSEDIHSRPMANVQSVLEDAPGVSIQRAGGLDGPRRRDSLLR